MLPLIVAEIYTGTVQGSPSSVVGLKSRGCRNLKRGETRVPIVCYCMLLYAIVCCCMLSVSYTHLTLPTILLV